MTAATGVSLSFGYDALKRLNRVTVKNGDSVILNTAYAYRDVSWNRGSAQVSSATSASAATAACSSKAKSTFTTTSET